MAKERNISPQQIIILDLGKKNPGLHSLNCEKNLKNYIIKMNNLFIAQNVPHIILGGGI